MKAVIYARYSCDNQREESIEGQIRECTEFAEKNGMTVLRYYIDRAYSAKTDNRPEFQNMIKDSGKKLFDVVLVWKLDRFARNRYDSARYKSILKKNGVKVVSATEVVSDGAEGIILESVLEGYAEYYSADLSEKVIRGMTENVLKNKFNGGNVPFGYVVDSEQHLQADTLTAPYVLETFKMYESGMTMKEIRDYLNSKNVKNTRGNPISYNNIEHMLKNRRYIGEARFKDTVIPNAIPAIVPQDLFDRVQARISVNKKAPARKKAKEDYLLTTKLYCGHCGRFMCGESGTGRKQVTHRYYKCVSVKNKTGDCKKKSVRKQWIEDLVVVQTMQMIESDERIEDIITLVTHLQDKENTELPLYEKQLIETETAIKNLLNAIQQGILTKSTKARLEELEKQQEELQIRIANEKIAKPRPDAEFIRFWLLKFRMLDVNNIEHRKKLIDTFVNAVFLYDDKLVITYNYSDVKTTVNFNELNGSDLECFGAPKHDNPNFSLYGEAFGLFFSSDDFAGS